MGQLEGAASLVGLGWTIVTSVPVSALHKFTVHLQQRRRSDILLQWLMTDGENEGQLKYCQCQVSICVNVCQFHLLSQSITDSAVILHVKKWSFYLYRLQYIYWCVEPPHFITTNPQQFISLQYIYWCVEQPHFITTNQQQFISLQYIYWCVEPPHFITTNTKQFISAVIYLLMCRSAILH